MALAAAARRREIHRRGRPPRADICLGKQQLDSRPQSRLMSLTIHLRSSVRVATCA
jgi:hypothetical protein